jgi:hypothetical protein
MASNKNVRLPGKNPFDFGLNSEESASPEHREAGSNNIMR